MAEAQLSLTPEKVAELSLVDLAYVILRQTNKTFHFRDLMQELARLKGLTEEQVNDVIARLYTEINIDGRFVCLGANVWGLKRWYPTDKTQEAKAAGGKKFVRKDADDDEDDYYDEDEDAYVEEEDIDDESYDAYDDEVLDDPMDDFVGEDEEVVDDDELNEDDDKEELDEYEEEEEDF
jgi:DNA-directed RNA polymerase subunit delta